MHVCSVFVTESIPEGLTERATAQIIRCVYTHQRHYTNKDTAKPCKHKIARVQFVGSRLYTTAPEQHDMPPHPWALVARIVHSEAS